MAGLNKSDVDKLKLVQELEMEMMNDMYNRLVSVCHGKCINTKYSEGEVGKGEAVCLDRCVAKFLETHDRVGKQLTALTVQDEEMMKKMQT